MTIKWVDSLPPPPAGDSSEQREAEAVMLGLLGNRLGVHFEPRAIRSPDGRAMAIDGVDSDETVYVEAFAHLGKPKGGQISKVIRDAFELSFLGQLRPGTRLIVLLADEVAAAPFRVTTWCAEAMRSHRIEVEVVDLPADVRNRLAEAQRRQYR
jgi:hypothetical protein